LVVIAALAYRAKSQSVQAVTLLALLCITFTKHKHSHVFADQSAVQPQQPISHSCQSATAARQPPSTQSRPPATAAILPVVLRLIRVRRPLVPSAAARPTNDDRKS
jgi:hypothetical protein